MVEQRKATDVLLLMELNINILLSLVRSQDLNIKILSNKLNTVILELKEIKAPLVPLSQPSIEAINVAPAITEANPSIKISSMNQLPLEQNPTGFRRTSRPETYSEEGSNSEGLKFPTQLLQQPDEANVVVPSEALVQGLEPKLPLKSKQKQPKQRQPKQKPNPNTFVPVEQRIADKNGKSVFLADVEIVDIEAGKKIHKTRTNGTGKWMAVLPFGQYRVVVRKREQLTKAVVEIVQEITVDGTESPLRLQMLIFK